MEAHIGAGRLRAGSVVLVRLRDDAFAISKTMAHSVGHHTISGEVSDHGAVFAPAALPSGDLALLFCGERL